MPLFGPPDVMKLIKQKDVKGLIKALNYKNSATVRGEAASMLGELGGAEAIGALIGALQDVDAGVRRKAVAALDHLRTERALEPLIALIQKEPDRIVRHFGIMAVSNSKDVRILKPLLSMVEAHGPRLIEDSLAVTRLAICNVGEAAIEPLKNALLYGKAHTRVLAAQCLEKLNWKPGEDISGAAFFAVLHKWEPLIGFGKMAIEPLSWLLKSVDADERSQAVGCLGEIEDEQAVSLLLLMLEDPSNSVRLKTVMELEKIDDPLIRERVAAVSTGLTDYQKDLKVKADRQAEQKRKEFAEQRQALLQRSICKVKFTNGMASLDASDGKRTLVDLFLQNEPAIIYELDEVVGKLKDFPWSAYPVAVNFGSKRKQSDWIRNFFRCSGTFTYQGVTGVIDKRPRIYFVSINLDGVLDLSGNIEYDEDVYRQSSAGHKVVTERMASVVNLENYGLSGNYHEVMQNSIYTMHLLGTDISSILAQFESRGTTFYSVNSRHIIRDDNDDVQFRAQVPRE
jgi:HEAT repeat protein